MSTETLDVLDWKTLFRKRARRQRAEVHAAAGAHVPQEAASRFQLAFEPDDPATIALYHPVEHELDTTPLAEALMSRGHAVVLPVVQGPEMPLQFRLWELDVPLEKGRFGIAEPGAAAPVMRPDIIVTPLLAVRPDGARLGMGGGYYDRTLTALRSDSGGVLAIGYGYDAQWQERFPVEAHDAALDGFVSEARTVAFGDQPA